MTPLRLLLAGLCLVSLLAALIPWLVWERRASPPAGIAPPPATAPEPPPSSEARAERLPPLEAPAPSAPPEDAARGLLAGRYTPVGAMVLGAEPVALLRDSQSGDILRVKTGDVLEGWTVAEVSRTQIVLRKGTATAVHAFAGNTTNR